MYSFNEPWDGPNNKKLLAYRVLTYECPSDPRVHGPGTAQTNYVAVVGSNAAWAGGRPRKIDDFTEGLTNTIMVVEVADAGISWTEPSDLSLDSLGVTGANSSALVPSSNHDPHSDSFYIYDSFASANVAMADGHVRYLPPGSLSAERLPKILQIGGCRDEQVESYEDLGEKRRSLNWPNIAALAVWLASVGTLLIGAVRGRKARAADEPT